MSQRARLPKDAIFNNIKATIGISTHKLITNMLYDNGKTIISKSLCVNNMSNNNETSIISNGGVSVGQNFSVKSLNMRETNIITSDRLIPVQLLWKLQQGNHGLDGVIKRPHCMEWYHLPINDMKNPQSWLIVDLDQCNKIGKYTNNAHIYLKKGTYRINANYNNYDSKNVAMRLKNNDKIILTSLNTYSGDGIGSTIFLDGIFIVESDDEQYYLEKYFYSDSIYNLGCAINIDGRDEYHGIIKIWKLK